MRHALHPLILCIGLLALVARAEDSPAPVTPPETKSFIDRNISKLVQLDPTPLTGPALDKVFAATFFTVKVNFGASGNTATLVAARAGDTLSDITLPNTPTDLPALKAIVKPDFKLQTDTDAKAFEAALDLLYPPDTRYDEKRKAIRHSGTEWTFIRGMFIGDYKGLIVATDANGTITSIKYSREIK